MSNDVEVKKWRDIANRCLAEARASNALAETAIKQTRRILRDTELWIGVAFLMGAFLMWVVLL